MSLFVIERFFSENVSGTPVHTVQRGASPTSSDNENELPRGLHSSSLERFFKRLAAKNCQLIRKNSSRSSFEGQFCDFRNNNMNLVGLKLEDR